jgi:hypothetical protein
MLDILPPSASKGFIIYVKEKLFYYKEKIRRKRDPFEGKEKSIRFLSWKEKVDE